MTSQTGAVIWESGLVEDAAEPGSPLASPQFQVYARVDMDQCVWIVRDFTAPVVLERTFKTPKAMKAWLKSRIDFFNERRANPAEEGNAAGKREGEASKMTREELLEFFRDLLGPHADPDLDKMSLDDLRSSYTNLDN